MGLESCADVPGMSEKLEQEALLTCNLQDSNSPHFFALLKATVSTPSGVRLERVMFGQNSASWTRAAGMTGLQKGHC